MGYVRKAAAVAAAGLVLAAAVPTLAEAAVSKFHDVVIRNTDSEPVPTKAIGTTPVSGTVSVDGPVSVSGPVSVPDGVAINGTPTVNVASGSVAVAPPERFSVMVGVAGGEPGGQEVCESLEVPEGKRYLVEAVHLDVSTTATDPGIYVRLLRGNNFLRFTTPLAQVRPGSGPARYLSGRLEGPLLAQPPDSGPTNRLSLCIQHGIGTGETSVRGVFVGVVETL